MDEPEASRYSVKMTIYDGDKELSWISGIVMPEMNGTGVQKTYIYKDKEGELVQINFWGEINVMDLSRNQNITSAIALLMNNKELE